MKKTLLSLLLITFHFIHSNAQETFADGLFFTSREVIQDKRTSLVLSPTKPLTFTNGFELQFEVSFRKKEGYYGNIVKILGNKEFNIDLICSFDGANNTKSPSFVLVVNNTIVHAFKWNEIPSISKQWNTFDLSLNPKNSTISLAINGIKKVKKVPTLSHIDSYDIVFGKSNLTNFNTTDVCPMSLKHVKIFEDKKLAYNWVLGKHLKNNAVYDEINKAEATTLNPKWLLDQHLKWSAVKSLSFDHLLGSTFDDTNSKIFFIDTKAVYTFDIKNQELDTLNYTNNPYPCLDNTFIYNQATKEIWSYSYQKGILSRFDFKTASWSENTTVCSEPDLWHHNKMIDPNSGNLITFGGYGHYNYKNAFHTLDLKSNTWKTNKTKAIEPRYLSAAALYNKDSFLIFGGFGSTSGSQAVNSHHFYDLYQVSFSDFKVHKLWKKTTIENAPFVPVSSLVVDNNKQHFYALLYNNNTFNTQVRLARFGIKQFEMTLFPEAFPYQFLDIKSNASLWLDTNTASLYAITINENKANLHSLAYPPLLAKEVFQEEATPWSFPLFIAIIFLGFAGGGSYIYLQKKKLKTAPAETSIESKQVIQAEKEQIVSPSVEPIAEIAYTKIKKSAIYLFGGFEVFDQEGKDISAQFTPTLKQLFLLILLSKTKSQKGVSSHKMIENLWQDKTENSARNNRNVNLSKLKILLEKIGNIEIKNENNYWSIHFEEEVFCDYFYVASLIPKIKNNTLDESEIAPLLKLIEAGEICPDFQNEWIDPFKVDIANNIIEALEILSKNQSNLQLLELIANRILNFDPLNEEAIIIKCKSLYAMGKKSLSKQSYDDFCREYHHLLEAKFNVAFKDIV
ncbi:Kelch repeat-containing protein [Flavobacterium sp. TSSA_36]|uniref:Kelch repeat-containing protein n=1 Tax=Flavobacterium sp. TSSA_36 TaxID=3447669 RepID=UPI003F33CB49